MGQIFRTVNGKLDRIIHAAHQLLQDYAQCILAGGTMKRYMAILGSFMFCVVCFSLYLMLESTAGISSSQNVDVGEVGSTKHFDVKL